MIVYKQKNELSKEKEKDLSLYSQEKKLVHNLCTRKSGEDQNKYHSKT